MSYIINKVKDMIDLNLVSLIIASDYRKIILEDLLNGPKTIREISIENNICSKSLYGPAKKLNDHNLVIKRKRKYAITEKGIEVIKKLHEIRGR